MSEAAAAAAPDVVTTEAEAAGLARPPLLVLEAVERFLDVHGLGTGPVRASRLGEGSSNVTFLLERGGVRYVLRRPPRPPLPPTAHDVVREARLQLVLAPLGVRVPRILAVSEAPGQHFYVMEHLAGHVVTDRLPEGAGDDRAACRRLVEQLVDALVEIHAVDVAEPAVAAFARPGHYLERQLRRFAQLWQVNATRQLPEVEEAGRRLAAHLPAPVAPAVVHGDYRLGNVLFAPGEVRLAAVLDWEMGAVGDPRADVGYLLATYSDRANASGPLALSPVTAGEGFPDRQEVLDLYRARGGREIGDPAWFEAFALWKAAVFCEAIYARHLRGETAPTPFAAGLAHGVPALARAALATAARAS